MKDGTGLRVALGALTGLGLGAIGIILMPPLLVPGGEALEKQTAAVVAGTVTAVDSAVAGSDAVTDARPQPDPQPDPRPPIEAALPPVPGFDTVRLEPDGTGLVAGRAEPGAVVSVLADDEAVAEVAAEKDGRFVAFLSLPPTEVPRSLSLQDDTGRISEETVILAPASPKVSAAVARPDGEGAAVAASVLPEAGAPTDGVNRPLPAGSNDVATGSALREDVTIGAIAPGLGGGPAEPEDAAGLADIAPTGSAPPRPGISDPAMSQARPTAEEAPAGSTASEEAIASSADPGDATRTTPTPQQPSLTSPPDLAASIPDLDAGSTPPMAEQQAEPSLPDRSPEVAVPPTVASSVPPLSAPEPSSAQSAVLLSDADGVRVLQPALPEGAAPEDLSAVALDAIAYDGAGEVVLSGRGSGGTVRVYLDNRPAGQALIDEDGQWTASLPDASAGVYTLRLDQIDAEGEVVSRIETPFQREERSSLQAAMGEAQVAGRTIAVRVVQPGNTLWAIARDRYGEPLMYVHVFEANRDRIRNPDLIYPGQVFVLPATAGR